MKSTLRDFLYVVVSLYILSSECAAEPRINEEQRRRIEQLTREHYKESEVQSVDMGFATNVPVTLVGGPSSPHDIKDPRYPDGIFERAFWIKIQSISHSQFNGRSVPITDNDKYYLDLNGNMAYEDAHYNGEGFHNLSMGLIPLNGWLKSVLDCLVPDQ